MATAAEPNCHLCRHYFVTWDRRAPHGCRAFAFKSPDLPCTVVLHESDIPCGSFEPRVARRTHRAPPAPEPGRLDVTG